MSNNHAHKALTSENLGRNAIHTSHTTEPYSHVTIVDLAKNQHNIPVAQSGAFNCYKRPGGTFVQPENAIPSSAMSGSGSESYLDFIIPNNLGLIDGVHLAWTVRMVSAASGNTLTQLPAWLQIARCEIFAGTGSTTTATLRGADMHHLWLASISDEQYNILANDYGLDTSNKAATQAYATATGASQTFERTFRVKIPSIFESRLFLPGIEGDVRIRIYFKEGFTSAVTGSPVLSLSTSQLEVDHVELTSSDWNRLYKLHRSSTGVSYRWCDLHNSSHNFSVSNGTEYSQILNSHQSSACAGLLVYFRQQSLANQHTFYSATSLKLEDDRGEKLTEVLTDQQLVRRVYPQTGYPGNGVVAVRAYHIPFCISLAAAFQGTVSGMLALSSRDKISFVGSSALAAAGSGSVKLEVTSINFCTLQVRNGRVTVLRS